MSCLMSLNVSQSSLNGHSTITQRPKLEDQCVITKYYASQSSLDVRLSFFACFLSQNTANASEASVLDKTTHNQSYEGVPVHLLEHTTSRPVLSEPAETVFLSASRLVPPFL